MTYRKFGLTSRALREAAVHAVVAPYGYSVDEILAEPGLSDGFQVSVSAKGWSVYLDTRNSGTSLHQDDAPADRSELVAQVADAAWPHWRHQVAGHMRTKALRSAGLTRPDACPAWSILLDPVILAVGRAAGFTPRRFALSRTSGNGSCMVFASLDDDETVPSTEHYVRDGAEERDYLKRVDVPSHDHWWQYRHAMQLLADERFPIRSVTRDKRRTTIELRSALPETQRTGLPGARFGDFIGMAGLEPGTVAGDLPILAVEHSDMWDRTSIVLPAVQVPAEVAPEGVDQRWAAMYARRTRRAA